MRWLRRIFSDQALADFLQAESGVEAPPPLPRWTRREPPAYTPAFIREPEVFIAPEVWIEPVVERPAWVPQPVVLNIQPRRVRWQRRVVENAPPVELAPAEVVAAAFIAELERDPTMRFVTDITDCTKIIHEFPRS